MVHRSLTMVHFSHAAEVYTIGALEISCPCQSHVYAIKYIYIYIYIYKLINLIRKYGVTYAKMPISLAIFTNNIHIKKVLAFEMQQLG